MTDDIKRLRHVVEVMDEMIAKGEMKEADDAEIAASDYHACLPATQEHIDSVPDIWVHEIAYGDCTICAQKIIYRDNVPVGNMKLICLPCAFSEMRDDPDPQIISRKGGADELREYLKKREQN
jgi:hypothetical protein